MCWGRFLVCSAIRKCMWVCWYNSIFRSACCRTTNVIIVLVAAYVLLHLPKSFDMLLTLLVHFLRCLLCWPSYCGLYQNLNSALFSATGSLLKCIQLWMPLNLLCNKTINLYFLLLFLDFCLFFFKFGFCRYCGAVLTARGHYTTNDGGKGFNGETWKTGWTWRLKGKSNS